MIFLLEEKMFRSRDLYVFVKSTITKFVMSLEVTLHLFLLNPKYYQNETWPNTSVSYSKHF